MKGTLLFNPVSIVHERNIPILADHLGGWNIRCIYNKSYPWFLDKTRSADTLLFKGGKFPVVGPDAMEGVRCVVLFTAQGRVSPCSIIEEASLKGVPVLAIEEVFMFMLEQGHINNYVLPVDGLLVASEYERKAFIGAGVPACTINVTGCPFGISQKTTAPIDKYQAKRAAGLDPEKRTATLCLSFIFPNGETLDVRRRLISTVSDGLPEDFQLYIKPHPSEEGDGYIGFIRRYAPRSVIAPSGESMDKILDVTDILFNRGNSQVVIDALGRLIPVAVVPEGRTTVFHDAGLKELIVESSDDIEKAITAIDSHGMSLYKRILNEHLRIPRMDAIKNVAAIINTTAAATSLCDLPHRLSILSMYWAWLGYRSKAIATMKKAISMSPDRSVPEGAVRFLRGALDDTALQDLKRLIGSGGYNEHILKSIWVRNLYLSGARMSREDVGWLSDFPPKMNRGLFLKDAARFYRCLIGSGFTREAEKISNMLKEDFSEIEGLIDNTDRGAGRIRYLKNRTGYRMELGLRDVYSRLYG